MAGEGPPISSRPFSNSFRCNTYAPPLQIVANKGLMLPVNPLDAIFAKNWGEGSRLWLTSHPQHPPSRITEYKSVPLLAGACDPARASLQTFLSRATEHGSRPTCSGASLIGPTSLRHSFVASPSCYKRTVAFPLHGTSRPLKKTPPSLTMESPVLTGASEKSPYLRARSMVAIET